MTDVYNKISRIALFSIMIISLVFLMLFYFGGAVPGTVGTQNYEPLITGEILGWSYILLIIALGASLFFFVSNMIKDSKKLVNFLMALGAVAVVVVISFIFSSGELLPIEARDYPDNNPSTLIFADTALFSTYILLGIAIVAILYTSISKMAK